jgi:hypothetical protein
MGVSWWRREWRSRFDNMFVSMRRAVSEKLGVIPSEGINWRLHVERINPFGKPEKTTMVVGLEKN